ncbi:hypothetical protein ACEE80_10285 [Streptococcus suis]
MELDFSKIDSIGSPKKPADTSITTDYSELPRAPKKPAESKPEAQSLQRKADHRKQQLAISADVLKEYQVNKRLTTSIVADINHGLQQGQDIYDLFLKAVEGLALTTNDPDLMTRSKEAIQSVYGVGLRKPRAVEIEKQETQKRLKRLIESLEEASDISDQLRLKRAIQAHQKRLDSL